VSVSRSRPVRTGDADVDLPDELLSSRAAASSSPQAGAERPVGVSGREARLSNRARGRNGVRVLSPDHVDVDDSAERVIGLHRLSPPAPDAVGDRPVMDGTGSVSCFGRLAGDPSDDQPDLAVRDTVGCGMCVRMGKGVLGLGGVSVQSEACAGAPVPDDDRCRGGVSVPGQRDLDCTVAAAREF